ncbi:hypothetical protein BE17_37995 [Sorangium cellulosum]|uniref:Uncharacterized protein n=1 Tax=Sorangium cellulosum TaxID=56 RepID=A0A150SGG2_SORCE|nr:hypothetical protein BE17_37995 [Sorangium cellulosum]
MLKSTVIILVFLALFAAVEIAFDLYRRPGVLTMRELGASLPSVGVFDGAALVCFDVLHGTLMIPHARQEAFWLPDGAPVEPWAEQLFWPFVRWTKKRAGRRGLLEGTAAAAELAAAEAVIHTADGRAVVVR